MKRGFVSILLLSVTVALLMISSYYIEIISVNKTNLEIMKDALIQDIEEFNAFQ